MAALTTSACSTAPQSAYPEDHLTTRNGKELILRFYAHSSLAICYDGRWIYVDPVGSNADYESQPKADYILVSHDHYDHLDTTTVDLLSTAKTHIYANASSIAAIGRGHVLHNGESVFPEEGIDIEAIPAYNFTEGHENFHPAGGRDNGYLLSLGGTRIYIAGDTENTPEMMQLQEIDIAFLPVNQPYTMTVDQAAEAVHAIRPAIFYPYHYGQVEEKTDIDRLVELVKDITDIRIRPME